MTISVENIIIGAGNMYIASPADAYYTTFETLSTATLNSNGSHIGATMDGIEVAYEPDYVDVVVDQLKDAAMIYQNGYRVTLRTNMAEPTLQNLKVAWGLPDSAVTAPAANKQRLNLPVPADEPTERRVIAIGRSPASTPSTTYERRYFARRAVAVDTSSHSLKRGEATVFPVAFRILGDPAYSDAQYGYIEDVTGP